jgi:subtilisin-like proprotein convertase family protein
MISRLIFLCVCVLLMAGTAGAQYYGPIVNMPTADQNPAVQNEIPAAAKSRAVSSTLDDPLGNVYAAGTTYYDLQHNGSAGKMLYVDQAGLVHLVWTKGFTSSGSGARHVMYQIWDPATSAMIFLGGGNPSGIQIDTYSRGGYVTIGGYPSGWVFPAFHETRATVSVAHSEGAIDYLPGLGAFTSTYPALLSPDGSPISTIWPKISVGADTVSHMLSEESPPSNGLPGYHLWQRLYYSRGVPQWDADGFGIPITWQTVAPGNEQYMLIDTITTISGDIAASKFSSRVAMAYTKPISHNPDSMNQYNNDVIVRISEDGGLSWGAPRNITNFLIADSLRAYTDVSLVFDQSDVLHVAFTTCYYNAQIGQVGTLLSVVWHWDEATTDFTVMANAYGMPFTGYALVGTWQRAVQRPSLSVDPVTGYLYSTLQVYLPHSYSNAGFYNADAYVTVSTNGGRSWAVGTNVSDDDHLPSPVAEGSCSSERDITLADRVTYSSGAGYLNLSYVLDRAPGAAPMNEGSFYNDTFYYQRVPVNAIALSPIVPTFPIHGGQVIPGGRCCYGPDVYNPQCAMTTYNACQSVSGQWDPSLTCATSCPAAVRPEGRCCYGYSPLTHYCGSTTEDICRAMSGQWNGNLNCETPCEGTIFCPFRDQANVYCDTIGGAIPDGNPNGADFIIHVPTQYHITRLTAAIDISHPGNMDLMVTLRSPSGQSSTLTSDFTYGADFLCTVFDDQAFDSVAGGYPPYSGTWLPMTPLAVFNGENAAGDWVLHVADVYSGNAGVLNWACLHIEYDQILPVELAAFDAVGQSDGIRISFATASENNNARFEILRGTSQGGPFSRVASLNSQGNSSSQQNYSFVDHEVIAGQTYWYYLADVSINGARMEHRDRMRSASIAHNVIPTEYSLSVYPNPFNPATTIQFSLTDASLVRLSCYDIAGRLVSSPLEKNFEAGVYHQTFDGSALPAGVYFVKIEAGSFSKTVKMMLLK